MRTNGPDRALTFGVDFSAAAKRNVPALQYFYNLESAVGLGQVNHKPSVLLSQYMLRVFLSRYGDQLGLAPIDVTGLVDRSTDLAIRAFQQWLQLSPYAGSVPVDGVLSPVLEPTAQGPGGSYVPPVLLLNRLWVSIQPETFANPARLADALGEEIAHELWESHPARTRSPHWSRLPA